MGRGSLKQRKREEAGASRGGAASPTGQLPEATPAPRRHPARCAYCVPRDDVAGLVDSEREPSGELAGRDECLIKMLGDWERRQVAMTHYRQGVVDGMFGRNCPMSGSGEFESCPFYEDVDDIDDES